MVREARMELARSVVDEKAAEYREREPLYPLEREQVETLPTAFETGEYGRRDAEWVVRWYYRRHLGAVPDAERRAAEDAFARNEFETVRTVVADVLEASKVEPRIERLTDLEGVDVPVASAFLFFLEPERYVVVGERTWRALRDAGELSAPYPEPPSIADYERYLERCRALCERFECDPWTLYWALWRCFTDECGDSRGR